MAKQEEEEGKKLPEVATFLCASDLFGFGFILFYLRTKCKAKSNISKNKM